MSIKFFQNNNKFIEGHCYETLEVNDKWTSGRPNGTSDEYGNIIPDSIRYVGEYLRSESYGRGNGRTRTDYFSLINVTLDYNGRTRYREVPCRTISGIQENIQPQNSSRNVEGVIRVPLFDKSNTKFFDRINEYIKRFTCCMCFENEINLLLNPCSHSYCKICIEKLKASGRNRCPICRTEIISTKNIIFGSFNKSLKGNNLNKI
jgi:hypothetical protein